MEMLLLGLSSWVVLCAVTAGLFVAVVRGGRGGADVEEEPEVAAEARVPAMRAASESALPVTSR